MIKRLFKRMMGFFMRPPGGVDCQQVMEQLYEYIDEEIEDRQRMAAIREHLRVCKRCFPHYEFEKAFLSFLAQRGGSKMPEGLRRRVFQRLLEQESQP